MLKIWPAALLLLPDGTPASFVCPFMMFFPVQSHKLQYDTEFQTHQSYSSERQFALHAIWRKSFFAVLQDSPQEPPTCSYWPWIWSVWILSILVNMFLMGGGEDAFSNSSRELFHSLKRGDWASYDYSTEQTDWPKASGRCFDKISHQQNASTGSSQLKSLVETQGKCW